MERANNLVKYMYIELSINPDWLESFKKWNGIVRKKVCDEANKVLSLMTLDFL